jgi:hypothetical protein
MTRLWALAAGLSLSSCADLLSEEQHDQGYYQAQAQCEEKAAYITTYTEPCMSLLKRNKYACVGQANAIKSDCMHGYGY